MKIAWVLVVAIGQDPVGGVALAWLLSGCPKV
jgi:hypothetical protein